MMEVFTHCPFQAMSEEQLKAFLEAVKADAGLQEKLKAAADADAVVAIAKAEGFVFFAEDLKRAQAEISEEELEGVAGGTLHTVFYGRSCGGGCISLDKDYRLVGGCGNR